MLIILLLIFFILNPFYYQLTLFLYFQGQIALSLISSYGLNKMIILSLCCRLRMHHCNFCSSFGLLSCICLGRLCPRSAFLSWFIILLWLCTWSLYRLSSCNCRRICLRYSVKECLICLRHCHRLLLFF